MTKKLYKSRTNVKVDGVCAGISNYFNFDPTLVRIGVVIVGAFTGIIPSIFAYIICAIIMPREPREVTFEQ